MGVASLSPLSSSSSVSEEAGLELRLRAKSSDRARAEVEGEGVKVGGVVGGVPLDGGGDQADVRWYRCSSRRLPFSPCILAALFQSLLH